MNTYLCPMSSVRLEKAASLVKRELSLIFQQNMRPMFDGLMITVTQVRISPDLGLAKVYLSFFPVEKRTEGLALVEEKHHQIRRLLGDAIGKQIRKIPDLAFYIDDSLDYFEEIDKLLKK